MLLWKSPYDVDSGGTWYFSDRFRFSSFRTIDVCKDSDDEAITVSYSSPIPLTHHTFQMGCSIEIDLNSNCLFYSLGSFQIVMGFHLL